MVVVVRQLAKILAPSSEAAVRFVGLKPTTWDMIEANDCTFLFSMGEISGQYRAYLG